MEVFPRLVSDADLYFIFNVNGVTTVARGQFSLHVLVAFSVVISQCTCLPVKAVHVALSLMCLRSSKVLHREVSWKRGRADDTGFGFLPSATAAPILLTRVFFLQPQKS